MASVSDRNDICIWDLDKKKQIKKIERHTREVTSLVLFQGGKRLASGSYDQTIRIWSLEKYQEIAVIYHSFAIERMTLTNNGFLCAIDSSGGLWMWSLHEQENRIKPELLWTTHPSLSCANAEITQAMDLSEGNQRLMMQHGAK